jgi:putative phosphoesterase
MRIAVVSDVHGNLAALEAVLADLDEVGPDLVVHGGDLALSGPDPAAVVDRIRELGWPGVLGNTDAAVVDPETIPHGMRGFMGPTTEWTRELLGEERIAWLAALPMEWRHDDLALEHAVPGDYWDVVKPDDPDERLREVYGPLRSPLAVYGHIHVPHTRRLDGLTVANSGSLSLALDGDLRAKYLLVDGGQVEVRRVPYDVAAVAGRLREIDYPNAEPIISWLTTGDR